MLVGAPQYSAPQLHEFERRSNPTTHRLGFVRVRSYEDLRVWQGGMQLVVMTYRLARKFPGFERYGLASQMQRAAVSIPANIAEGHGRRHIGDKLRHLWVANGSLKELETEARIARELGYISAAEAAELAETAALLGKMMTCLTRRLLRHRALPTTDNPPPAA